MKVVLVYPPYRNEEFYSGFGEVAPTGTPNGIAYLGAYLNANGHETKIYDMAGSRMSLEDLRKVILKEKPDLFGATANSILYFRAKALTSLVKSINPKIITVLGGRHPSVFPERVLRDARDTDYLVCGEGEITARELCDVLEQGGDVREVHGTALRHHGEAFVAERRPLIPDLDVLPFPAYDQLPLDQYHDGPGNGVSEIQLGLMATRGCPHNCVFCTSPVFWQRRVRQHSPEYVERLMSHCVDTLGVDDFWFRDDTFLANPPWVSQLCDRLIDNPRTFHFKVVTTVRSLEEALCRRMREAGCYQVDLGVESGSPRLIHEIKGVTKQEAREKIGMCHRLGLNVRAMYVVTVPQMRHNDVEKTIKFAIELDTKWFLYCLTVPYPDSRLWAELEQDGVVLPHFEDHIVSRREVEFVPPGYTREFLERQIKTAYVRFYFRPRYIWRMIRSLNGSGNGSGGNGLLRKYLKGAWSVAKYGLGFNRANDLRTSIDPFGM